MIALLTSLLMATSVADSLETVAPLHDTAKGDSVGTDSVETASKDEVKPAIGRTITIKGQRRHRTKEVSRREIRVEEIRKVAATMNDPIRSLSTLPGVTNTNDVSARPVVRGGSIEETRVSYDGVSLIQPYHFGGIFSVIHQEGVDDLRLYSSAIPAPYDGALSGTIDVRGRTPSVDSLSGGVDLSVMRGSAWLDIPLRKNEIGLWVAGQSVWYDFVIKRGMDLFSLMGAVPSEDVDQYKAQINLPTAWDAQADLYWRVSPSTSVDLFWLRSGDYFNVLDSAWRYFDASGNEVPKNALDQWGKSLVSKTKGGLDTAAWVSVSSQLLRPRLRWQEQGTKLEASLLWQYQDWDVAFPEGEDWDWTTDSVTGTRRYYKVSRESDTRLDWRRDWWQARIEGTLPWRDDHELGAGLSTRYGVETAKAQLARLLSGMILGTLENPLDMLGMVDEDGFTIRDNSEDRDFVSEILQNVMLQDSLRQKYWTVDGWVTDLWDVTPETRIRSGVRLEGDTRSGTLWPSPRVQVQHKLTEQDNLGVGIALHTQNEMALEWQLDAPKTLKPQKSAIASVEWERDLGNSWQFELNGWGKGYWDLVAPRMGYTGNVDSTLLHNNLEQWVTDLYNQQVLKSGTADSLVRRANQDGWQDYLYDATFRAQLRSLDPAGYDRAVMLSRQRRLLQSNSGVGFAAGLESSLRYHPADFWMGWLSGEVALSRRRDSVGGLWYNFGVDRRWKLSWVNAFQMPSRYELTLRYTAMSGMPYTPFTGGIFGGSSDTLFWVGKRNSSWFSPYQRLDFKLSKRSTLIRKPFVSYLEIWNAWNDPNWLLRDSETKQFRWINYNIPVPTVFLGCELRF